MENTIAFILGFIYSNWTINSFKVFIKNKDLTSIYNESRLASLWIFIHVIILTTVCCVIFYLLTPSFTDFIARHW
jgi:hypothetical protein